MVSTKETARERAWERRLRALGLACTCWACLRRHGITPHRGAPLPYRTDGTGRTFASHTGEPAARVTPLAAGPGPRARAR
jgi:hypothetical protein